MANPKVISPEFLLWSQSLLLWSIAAYGIVADPLKGEASNCSWTRWSLLLAARATVAPALAYALSRSMSLSALLLLSTLLQPLLRYRLPMQWLAEFEALWISVFMVSSLVLIRSFHLPTQCTPALIAPAQAAALCILASSLFLVVRGGTYIVRGILRKSGTLPSKKQLSSSAVGPQAEAKPVTSMAASAEHSAVSTIDVEEYNRGRLIGNLERIVLTIVVTAGSYAALAFLVAAKGVVRADEFEKNRDFTEYFLIGSLASVLVALAAGLALRFALVRLWPDLLALQMQ